MGIEKSEDFVLLLFNNIDKRGKKTDKHILYGRMHQTTQTKKDLTGIGHPDVYIYTYKNPFNRPYILCRSLFSIRLALMQYTMDQIFLCVSFFYLNVQRKEKKTLTDRSNACTVSGDQHVSRMNASILMMMMIIIIII